MSTDLNTLDDWRTEGFDDFFAGASVSEAKSISPALARIAWWNGWYDAMAYRNALRGQTDE